jgi:hypothetical protein
MIMDLGKFSFGIGDRFSHQGVAQLKAISKARKTGINIVPVWNKSNREHAIVGTSPADTRKEADQAVAVLKWKGEYHVDADHINLDTVKGYIPFSDFFTIDVAEYIGKPASSGDTARFMDQNRKYMGDLEIPGLDQTFRVNSDMLQAIAGKFLFAAKQAGEIYRFIHDQKGSPEFITEVSMDEVDQPQTPVELFFILGALADENIPVQTIAPKFTGRFNKGVDYQGNIEQFRKEFEQDLLVIDHAVREFGLPGNLKLSVHSGSDKFSIYPVMGRLIRQYDKGLHLKTAGTTWLEEVIGLAMAEGQALDLAKKIYTMAYERKEELCRPYATVIDINEDTLPPPAVVWSWDGKKFAGTLRHIPDHPLYNPSFRQLIHVGYKVAAELGKEFYNALLDYSAIIGDNVYENLYERHISRLFV